MNLGACQKLHGAGPIVFVCINVLFDIAKRGLVVLDGTVDVPGNDRLLAGVVLVDRDIAQVGKLALVKLLADQLGGLHRLAPREGRGELLLGGLGVVAVGAQKLLQDDLAGDVVGRDVELDTPHLLVVGIGGDFGEASREPGERRLGRLGRRGGGGSSFGRHFARCLVNFGWVNKRLKIGYGDAPSKSELKEKRSANSGTWSEKLWWGRGVTESG